MQNISFSTERAKQVAESKFLDAGIHENVKFIGVDKDTSPNGNVYLKFSFEKDGKDFSHTEWQPKKFNDADTSLQERTDKMVKRIMEIMKVWYPAEIINFTGNTFDEFTTWVTTMLNAVDKSELLRIKIVYNKNGYTTLPNVMYTPFIEKMSNKDITVVKHEKDIYVRPIKADVEKPSTEDDDMPF